MYIESLKIRDLRCFESAAVSLRCPGEDKPGKSNGLNAPNVNLLLGNNGAGKTTLLRAIALSALAPIMARSAGYVPRNMVRRKAKSAQIDAVMLLHDQDLDETIEAKTSEHHAHFSVRIIKEGDHEFVEDVVHKGPSHKKMYDDRSPAFLVVGYGATRRVEDSSNYRPNDQRRSRTLKYQRVAGLFESHIALTPLDTWLPDYESTNKGRYTQVVHLLDRLLPEGSSFTGERESGGLGEYLFNINGVASPFSALSDGYRAYIGWVADLLYHVCFGSPAGAKLVENRGVVLVDEIDLHLHPEWQRTVVASLAEALPNLQFIFSTHSPIVAGSLESRNIFVMEPAPAGASTVDQYSERIYGLDAQQVLLSPYFGLKTTRAPQFMDELSHLSRQLSPGRSDIALSIMRKLAGVDDPVESKPTLAKATRGPKSSGLKKAGLKKK